MKQDCDTRTSSSSVERAGPIVSCHHDDEYVLLDEARDRIDFETGRLRIHGSVDAGRVGTLRSTCSCAIWKESQSWTMLPSSLLLPIQAYAQM